MNERGRPLKANGLLWLLHRYGDQVGVELTPHQLRHTFARQAVEAGMPLPSLGKLLGHTNLDTTLATRRLNAGMDITRIQKLLGHTQLSTTQVLDATLEADYRPAMTRIERQSLPLSDEPVAVGNWPVWSDTRQNGGLTTHYKAGRLERFVRPLSKS